MNAQYSSEDSLTEMKRIRISSDENFNAIAVYCGVKKNFFLKTNFLVKSKIFIK